MGVIDNLVTQPVLWIVCAILSYVDGSLLSNPDPFYQFYPAKCDLSLDFKLIAFVLSTVSGGMSLHSVVLLLISSYAARHVAVREDKIIVASLLLLGVSFGAFCLVLAVISGRKLQVFFRSSSFRWLVWNYPNIQLLGTSKLLAQSTIFAFKNRRSCQLLLLIASVLIGILGSSSARKFLALIPLVVGFILTFPDFDLEPSEKFRFRFTRFVAHNMDEESIQKLLDSKHCKMMCCNEMVPSLADLDSPVFSCFVKRENRQFCDSIVNPRYEIGLGSVLTWSNEHQIEVLVSTPQCGIKRLIMRNTELSRCNLHNSVGFWRDNPRLGILNNDEVKTHCISTEDWIQFCGSEEFIFVAFGHHGDV